MAKKVTVIKAAKAQKHTQEERRLKVCGYARVSTGSQAQATSYTAQVEYYTEKIESNPLWEFAGVYADEGISGTNVKHRDEFQMMISDCEDGNIDLILTKSITRFARNTVECIQTIRKLKEIGVGIYFEKENINTLSEKSELFITILASVAQGGIRKHLKQQPMGDTETLSGWNLYHIDASVWLWKRRGWKFSHHRIRGRNRKVDL